MKKDLIFINNQYVTEPDAKISVFDRGFLFADGVYEVIPVYSNKALFLIEHLKRLQNSLDHINIKYKVDNTYWSEVANKLISHNGANRPIYIQITRGADYTRVHEYHDQLAPTLVAFSLPPITLGNSLTSRDVNIITLPDNRWKMCHVKSLSLLGNILLRNQAKSLGASEALLVNDEGYIIEGTSSNYFIVQNNKVLTPPLNNEILPGVTRQAVIDICTANKIQVIQKNLQESDLYNADELWITSTTREVVPASKLNGKLIGDGKPGPVWQIVSNAYLDYIENQLK